MNPQSRALKIGLVTALLLATFVIGIIAFRPEPQQSQRSASPTTMTPTETLTAVNSSPDERLNPNGRTSSAAHDRADIGTTHAPAPPANTTAAATTTTATAQTAATPTYTPGYASSGNDNQITDEAVAAQHNLTVEQVRRLQKERALTNNSIATLTDAQLKRALSRLEQPKAQMLEDMLRQRAAQMKDENGDIPENALVRAVEQKAQMPVDPQVWGEDVKTNREGSGGNSDPLVAGIDRNSWTAIGPGNIGGRTRAIAINPTNANIIYLGSVGGGVWKTTNGGANWTPLNDFMANLAVTSIVIDPTNTSVIYAATGEGFNGGDAIRGAGIFKSTNAGATWTQLASTANNGFYAVNRLAMNPNNSQILLAATGKIRDEGIAALWRSTNGGVSWTQTLSGAGFLFTDVDFNPANGNFAIAGCASEPDGSGTAFYSTDGGQTWAPSTGTYVGGPTAPSFSATMAASINRLSTRRVRLTISSSINSCRRPDSQL